MNAELKWKLRTSMEYKRKFLSSSSVVVVLRYSTLRRSHLLHIATFQLTYPAIHRAINRHNGP